MHHSIMSLMTVKRNALKKAQIALFLFLDSYKIRHTLALYAIVKDELNEFIHKLILMLVLLHSQ